MRYINNPKARDFFLEIMLEWDLSVDCWLEEHYKWKKIYLVKKDTFKTSRLDFLLISGPLFTSPDDSRISPGYRSDHSLISITVDIKKSAKGHSYWKFNNSFMFIK